MSHTVIMSVAIAFAISVILGPVIIPFLRKLKVGQTERDDGPKSHLKKSGTPTMGGILILIGITATSVIYMKDYPKIMPILFVTLGFGLIGFLDDYIKVSLVPNQVHYQAVLLPAFSLLKWRARQESNPQPLDP